VVFKPQFTDDPINVYEGTVSRRGEFHARNPRSRAGPQGHGDGAGLHRSDLFPADGVNCARTPARCCLPARIAPLFAARPAAPGAA
jgi:hypothetical protein